MTKIVIFSVEGQASNTEVNFFDGLNCHLPHANLKCHALGRYNSKPKTQDFLLLALNKAETYLKEPNVSKIVFLFVGDFDRSEHVPSMLKTAEWACEIISEYKDILYDGIEILTINHVFGDAGHSIETSLNRTEIQMSIDNSKRESNKNLFNDSIAETSWIENNVFNIDNAIKDLDKIDSNYSELFKLIKEHSK